MKEIIRLRGKRTRYMVTVDGEVYSISEKRTKKLTRGWITPHVVPYAVVGIGRVQYVHTLIAEAYLDKPDENCVATFKDGDTTNITLSNIHYVTRSHLSQSLYDTGKMDASIERKHAKKRNRIASYIETYNAKIKELYASISPKLGNDRGSVMITELYNSGKPITLSEIARRHVLTRERIRQIITNSCKERGIPYGIIKKIRPISSEYSAFIGV